jgi:hypothetical protein
MKVILFNILIIILLMVHPGCSKLATVESLTPVSQMKNNISVMVHPRIELISIIQTIGDYPQVLPFLMSGQEFEYKTRVMEHFSPFAAHPAVKMFDRQSSQPRKLNFSAPSNIMLFTDQNFQVRKDIELDDFVIGRIDGIDSLEVFLGLLMDFEAVTNFSSFYQDNLEYYQAIIKETIENLGENNYIKELEDFYGRPQHSYNIILVSLYSSLGYGNSLLLPDGMREIYNTMGSGELKDELPFFGDEKSLKYLIWHEFSHPYINPLTELYHDLIMPFENNFESLPEAARQRACGEWEECINEFIIRAITTWLAMQECQELGKWAYDYELRNGVVYLDILIEKLQYYQDNRSRYPALDDFYPQLLEVFLID